MILNLKSVVNFGCKWKKPFARGPTGPMPGNNLITSTFPTGQSQERVVNQSMPLFFLGGGGEAEGVYVNNSIYHFCKKTLHFDTSLGFHFEHDLKNLIDRSVHMFCAFL